MTDPVVEVEAWVREVVVGLGLCPFAAAPLAADEVRIVSSRGDGDAEVLAELLQQMRLMDEGASPSTTLLVIPGLGWEDFLDLTAMAEGLIEVHGYEGTYQLATFHPEYLFADAEPDDPAHRTNRAPHPTLQVLRSHEVQRAIEAFGDTAAIFERNIALMRERG
jgi:hypothetical protein